MLLGINMFWALLKLILNESESGLKHIYAREHKRYCYINFYLIRFYLLSSGTVESQEQQLRFPALENLYLDHNELTDLSTFASLAGLRK